MRYLGLDLGTKTIGVALSDKTRTIANPLKVIRFKEGDYEDALNQVIELTKEYDIGKIILGMPKNMNNSLGFASQRSLNFKDLLMAKTNIPIYLVDERLTTLEAQNILLSFDLSRGKRKKVIDGVSAMLILDTYLKMEGEKSEGRN